MSEQDKATLDRQVSEWRREVARLQDLIAAATDPEQDKQGAEREAFEAAYRQRYNMPAHTTVDFPEVPHAFIWWQAGRAALRAEQQGQEPVACANQQEGRVNG